ncbi:MAG: hydroxyacid dehydrogenase [Sphingobacteriales bacterium]|nr:MAG: hydroxyacid dehydrogenase [Sphingobacteriales bacterium]
MSGKVLIAAAIHEVLREGLEREGYELLFRETVTQQEAFDILPDCVGVITSTRLILDKGLIERAPLLKWIGRMGSGMEIIDVPFAVSRGILCVSSPEGNSNAVGEHALGLLLSLSKKIASSSLEVREGKWIRDANRGFELEGKTVGLIGFGHTGKAFARKLSGFDVNILAYDIDPEVRPVGSVALLDNLERIFAEADIVSFHVPLKPDTNHLFDAAFLSCMKKPFVLLNTSRGPVVNTAVVLEGLLEKKIVAAGLDVLEVEPPSGMGIELKAATDKLLSLPNVIITPHIAGYSNEAVFKMSSLILQRIVTPA